MASLSAFSTGLEQQDAPPGQSTIPSPISAAPSCSPSPSHLSIHARDTPSPPRHRERTQSSKPPPPSKQLTPSVQLALADPALAKSLSGSPAPSRAGSEADDQTHAKRNFELNVRRYYYQLTVGCQQSHCSNRLCRSCLASPKMSKDAAAILSVQLAARPRLFFCSHCPLDPAIPATDLPLSGEPGDNAPNMITSAHSRQRTASGISGNIKCTTSSARSSPGIKHAADDIGRTRDSRIYEPSDRSESTPSFPRLRALSPLKPAPSTCSDAHRTPVAADNERHTEAGMPLFRSLLSVSPFSDMFSSSKSTSLSMGSGQSRLRRSFSNSSFQDTHPRTRSTRNMLAENGTSKKKPQPRSFSPPVTSQRHRMTDMMDRVHTWRSKTTMSTPASLYGEDAVGLGLTSRSLQSRDFLDLSQYYRSVSDSQKSTSNDQKPIRHKWHTKAVDSHPSCTTPQFGSTRDPDSDEDSGSALGNDSQFPPTDLTQWTRSESDDLQLSPSLQTPPFGPCDSTDLPSVSPSRLLSKQKRPLPFAETSPRRRDSVGSVGSTDSGAGSSINQPRQLRALNSLPGKEDMVYPSSSPLIFNRRSSFNEQGQTDFTLPYLNLTLLRQAIVTYNSSTADAASRTVSSSDLILKPIPTVARKNTVDSLQRLLGSAGYLNLDSEVSLGGVDLEDSETSAILESASSSSSKSSAHEPTLAPDLEDALYGPCISPTEPQMDDTGDRLEHRIRPEPIELLERPKEFDYLQPAEEMAQLKSPTPPIRSTPWYSSLGSTEGDSTFLLDSLRSVFASASALGSSFLIKDKEARMLNAGSGSASVDDDGVGGIDLEALRECYEMMIELKPRTIFAVQVTSSMELLLARLELELEQLGDLKVWSEEEMRALIVLLMNPFLFEQPYQESLLRRILLIFTSLPDVSTLCNWLSWLDEEGLAQLVTLFKMYLSAHFTPRPSGATHPAICAVQALDILYRANMIGTKREQARRRRSDSSDPLASAAISYKYFYSGVMEALKFKDEYLIWRKNWGLPDSEKQFSYFDYPFLMSPTSKSHIINLDALTQMAAYYEDACVRHALADHAQRLLPEAGTPSAREFQKGIRAGSSPYLVLELTRAHLVEEAFEQITKKHADLKKPLKVAFVDVGEEGMDQGGVTKEFFQIMVEKVFDSQFGLFRELEEGRCWWFEGQLDGSYPLDVSVKEKEMRLVEYELVGILVGLALYNGVILGVRFPTITYRKLLGWEIDLDSFSESFPALGRGLEQMLSWSDGDVYDIFMRSFEISYEHLSQVTTLPLIPGGEDIPVTNENRATYVDAYIRHYVYVHVDQEFQAFQRGFDKICGGEALKLLRPEELELLLCGNTELDMHDLEANCLYDDGYSSNHTLIKEFWEVVHNELTPEQHKKLLAFVTGSDRVPIRGLKDLTFVIQRNGPDSDRLPTALTCFSRLLLPEFSGKDKLKERLVTAIENANGFGLV